MTEPTEADRKAAEAIYEYAGRTAFEHPDMWGKIASMVLDALAKARAEGAREEREKVVAFAEQETRRLRKQGLTNHGHAVRGFGWRIERGEHRKEAGDE